MLQCWLLHQNPLKAKNGTKGLSLLLPGFGKTVAKGPKLCNIHFTKGAKNDMSLETVNKLPRNPTFASSACSTLQKACVNAVQETSLL